MTALPPPILDDLLEITEDDGIRLLGTRAGRGGPVLFPRRRGSALCDERDLEDVVLSGRGVVWSWTVSRLGGPVVVGFVELAEGPIVQAYLVGDPDRPPPIGTPVEAVPHVLDLGESGGATTYAFRPLRGGRDA